MINKAIIVGNLGKDPESKHTSNGSSVSNFSVATSETWKDKNTGERKEATEWHRVVAFGRTADVVNQYLSKGSKVYVEGKIQTRKWQDKEGNDRYTTEILANNIKMMDGKSESGQSRQQSRAPELVSQGPEKPAPQQAPVSDFLDDDVPF